MKQMTCSALGGPCDAVIPANTIDEMMTNGMAHVTAVHPELAEKIKAMPKEEVEKWSAEMHAKWEAEPEMAAPTTPEVPSTPAPMA